MLEKHYVERNAFGDPVWETVPISNLAVHPANLGGSYTQGLACKSLIENVLRTGFSKEEADSKGVAVRAKPPNKWDDYYESFLTYNIIKSQEDPFLAGAYREDESILMGVLAHAHLLNASRCYLHSE